MSIRCPGDVKVRDLETTCMLLITIDLIFITELNKFLSVLDKRADDMRSKIKHAADRKPRLCIIIVILQLNPYLLKTLPNGQSAKSAKKVELL